MDTHLKLGFRHMRPLAAMVSRAKKKVAELEELAPGRISNCEIVVVANEAENEEGYRIGIDLDLGDRHIAIGEDDMTPAGDVYSAFDESVAALAEKLKLDTGLPIAAD